MNAGETHGRASLFLPGHVRDRARLLKVLHPLQVFVMLFPCRFCLPLHNGDFRRRQAAQRLHQPVKLRFQGARSGRSALCVELFNTRGTHSPDSF